jgi:hypothetical protein
MARQEAPQSIGKLNPVQKLQPVHAIAAEREYFEGLVNEVPDIELEAKLVFKEEVKPHEVLTEIMDNLSFNRSFLTLFVPHILSTSNIVDKYSYGDGNLSVLHRQDGTTAIKRKLKKTKKDNVIIRGESKVDLDNDQNPLQEASEHYGIPRDEMAYVGTLKREKSRIVLSNDRSGRVYTLVIDTTSIADDPKKGERKPLQQMEIEYKGTDPLHSNPYNLSGTLEPIDEIALEIAEIRQEIGNYLQDMGLPVSSTNKTKTKWLKEQKKRVN